MSVPLEQLLASDHLRIVTIADLEPRALLGIIKRVLMLSDNALQVQFASFLKQGNSRLINVICKNHRRQTVADYPSQFVFPVQQPLASQVLATCVQ